MNLRGNGIRTRDLGVKNQRLTPWLYLFILFKFYR